MRGQWVLAMQKDESDLPLVSVVIPSYNSAATLPATLDSVLAQTYPHIETIVVDDGSTDATGDVLARYAPRIRAIRQANGGLARARNAGCTAATGQYIALLDADDLCEPERIGAQVALFAARPDVVLCGTEFGAFDETGTLAARFARKYYSRLGKAANGPASLFEEPGQIDIARWMKHPTDGPVSVPVHAGDVYRALVLGSFIHPPTVMFSRSMLQAAGLFDERIRNCCDWEWLVRVARAGKCAFIDRPLLRYRLSATQMSGARHKLQLYTDILGNLRQFAHDDPQVPVWGGRAYEHALGNACVNLAGALVEDDRMKALTLLAEAARHGTIDRSWARYLAKALMPRMLVQRIQARKRVAVGA
jgi:glycosyltransferase involved in cell wall biosynthesis